MIGKRTVALFVCSLVTTITPAVYQYGIEPRFQGAQCDIEILTLELYDTSYNSITFKAFLRIENDADTPVILSRLDLDVYFYSNNLGRFQLIGNLSTDQEYTLEANDYIQSTGTGERTINALNPSQRVYGYLTFKQGVGLTSGTNEAISKLIQKGFLNIIMKGKARVGPFSFAYEKPNTLSIDFWDSNFVIKDILPYAPYTSTAHDSECVIVHAKMRNPSGIPLKIEDFTIDLYDSNENLRATGINNSIVALDTTDPDTDEKTLAEEWLYGNKTIYLSSEKDKWEDIFFGFNFTDPIMPGINTISGTDHSKTRENLNWFFSKLMTEDSITEAIFRGDLTMVMGGYDEVGKVEGVRISMTEANEPFTLYDVNLHQQHYSGYDGQAPINMLNDIDIGEIVTDKITIDTDTKNINMDYTIDLNISNPYRFDFEISGFETDFVRINETDPYLESEHFSFAYGNTTREVVLPIARGTRSGKTIVPTVTELTLNLSTNFNTGDFVDNSGVGKVLSDFGVDPQALNLTDPFWLMGPKGKDIDPLQIIEYLITKEVDPLAILEYVNNTKIFFTSAEANFPLDCMFFGSNLTRDMSYSGTYNFENDAVDSFPNGWSWADWGTLGRSGCTIEVKDTNLYTTRGHSKIVEMYDNGGSPNVAAMSNTFYNQSSGTIEVWMKRNDAFSNFSLQIINGSGTDFGEVAVQVGFNVTREICVTDGGSYINTGEKWVPNQWIHVRVDFDCGPDTYDLYINNSLIGNYDFNTTLARVNVTRFTSSPGGTGLYGYVDAVGYSWDPQYYVGDNMIGGVENQINEFSDMPWIDRYGETWNTNNKFRFAPGTLYAKPDRIDVGGAKGEDWSDYAYDRPEYVNQYDFASRNDTGWNNFPNDQDLDSVGTAGRYKGAILDGSVAHGILDNIDMTNGLIWRVYVGGGAVDNDWGYMYDWEFDGDRNYFIGIDVDSGDQVMFSQNFTLDKKFEDNQTYEITSATLSVNYRYLDSSGPGGGFFGLGWFDGANYSYVPREGLEKDLFPSLPGNRDAWQMNYSYSDDWCHRTIDIKDEINSQLNQYSLTSDADKLNGEVSFSAFPKTILGIDNTVLYVDDVVLSIEYTEHADSIKGIDVKDFFAYTESEDPSDGSMYNILEDVAYNGTQFFNFLGDDNGQGAGEGGIDYTEYMQLSNASLSLQTDLLTNDYTSIGGFEPSNFLEMLTMSKYTIPEGGGSTFVPGLGYRDLNDKYWVIEDPYKTSRIIAQTLYDKVFMEDGAAREVQYPGEELWYMFENLEMYLPWVMMYLITHGWTKDDIFDMLEAIGFASEVHTDWNKPGDNLLRGSDQIGFLGTTISLVAEARLAGDWFDVNVDFPQKEVDLVFSMGDNNDPIFLTGYHKLYEELASTGSDWDFNDDSSTQPEETNSRKVIWTGGDIANAYTAYYTGSYTDITVEICLFGIICGDVTFDATLNLELTPTEFFLHMGIGDLPGSVIPPDTTNVYQSAYGLNDAGTLMLSQLLRQNLKFSGTTFIQTGGDPISLFQFLDNYFFTNLDTVDYSSYTLMNLFNARGTDFIDIITGYDQITGTHDPNQNGKADDWGAPAWYTDSGRDFLGDNAVNPADSGNSWGTNFLDNRLWYGADNPSYGQIDGHIIWTDSTALLGKDNGSILAGVDNIAQGAPPIVSLIDMLAWISKTTGKPDPNDLMEWLLGEKDDKYYDLINPYTGSKVVQDGTIYNFTLSNQETFRMFQQCGFNSTGYMSWLNDKKGIIPFTFLQEIYEREGILAPADLIFFATNPNYISFSDGAMSWVYHDAVGSTAESAESNFWLFLNGSWWNHSRNQYGLWKNPQGKPKETLPYLIYEDITESGMNAFTMYDDLGVDVASWINLLQYTYDIKPFNILSYVSAVNDLLSLDTTKGKKTRAKVNGTLRISFLGIDLYDDNPAYGNAFLNDIHYGISDRDLYANVHFADFMNADRLYRENFVIT